MTSYLIDLDGTIYRGNQLIDGAAEFIQYLLDNDIPFLFLTNNAALTQEELCLKCQKLGIKNIRPQHFYNSAMASVSYALEKNYGKKAFVIGKNGLTKLLIENNFELVEKDADVVFVGLDPDGNYHKYSLAVQNIMSGAKLIGTNNDRRIPKEDGYHLGNGSVVEMLEYATNTKSPKIGKPHKIIVEKSIQYLNVKKEDVYIIGDNLETDILAGINNGIKTILVLTGVHDEKDVRDLNIIPDSIINNLKELIK